MLQWACMVIILGLGFTGARLARRLLARGVEVYAPVRNSERFRDLTGPKLHLTEWNLPEWDHMALPKSAVMAVTIPPLQEPDKTSLRQTIQTLAPGRLVYVSSTGVYGDQVDIDENSTALATDERGRVRLEEEAWIAAGPWSSLILRAAAIYGPGRGVHVAMREGRLPRGSASGVVSRIHVDDLAALAEAALFSTAEGAWPVADDAPCASDEIARFLGFSDLAEGVPASGRSVNGRGIRKLLGVELHFPSWRTGIPACLDEEAMR
jgi:nucleoside-diphosphate-sugar epimerase